MSLILNAEHDGQLFPIDLSLVTGLDALVYRRATGEDLDARLWAMVQSQPESAADWPLADKAILSWLFHRAVVDRDVTLAAVAATLTLLPAAAPAAGTDAPGAG